MIVNVMNAFGERQHVEKFIPLCIKKIVNNEKIFIPNLKKDANLNKIDKMLKKKEEYIRKNDEKFIQRKNFIL